MDEATRRKIALIGSRALTRAVEVIAWIYGSTRPLPTVRRVRRLERQAQQRYEASLRQAPAR